MRCRIEPLESIFEIGDLRSRDAKEILESAARERRVERPPPEVADMPAEQPVGCAYTGGKAAESQIAFDALSTMDLRSLQYSAAFGTFDISGEISTVRNTGASIGANTASYSSLSLSSGFFRSIEKPSTPSNEILSLLRTTRSVLCSVTLEAPSDDISSSFHCVGDDTEN